MPINFWTEEIPLHIDEKYLDRFIRLTNKGHWFLKVKRMTITGDVKIHWKDGLRLESFRRRLWLYANRILPDWLNVYSNCGNAKCVALDCFGLVTRKALSRKNVENRRLKSGKRVPHGKATHSEYMARLESGGDRGTLDRKYARARGITIQGQRGYTERLEKKYGPFPKNK